MVSGIRLINKSPLQREMVIDLSPYKDLCPGSTPNRVLGYDETEGSPGRRNIVICERYLISSNEQVLEELQRLSRALQELKEKRASIPEGTLEAFLDILPDQVIEDLREGKKEAMEWVRRCIPKNLYEPVSDSYLFIKQGAVPLDFIAQHADCLKDPRVYDSVLHNPPNPNQPVGTRWKLYMKLEGDQLMDETELQHWLSKGVSYSEPLIIVPHITYPKEEIKTFMAKFYAGVGNAGISDLYDGSKGNLEQTVGATLNTMRVQLISQQGFLLVRDHPEEEGEDSKEEDDGNTGYLM